MKERCGKRAANNYYRHIIFVSLSQQPNYKLVITTCSLRLIIYVREFYTQLFFITSPIVIYRELWYSINIALEYNICFKI